MTEDYPFLIPDSSKNDLEIALETGPLPPWQRYPEPKWNPETAEIPWFQEAVGDWHSQAQDLVGILLDRLKPKEFGIMPEVALVKALALTFEDLRALLVASDYTWMFDPIVLKARERQKQEEERHETIQCAAESGATE